MKKITKRNSKFEKDLKDLKKVGTKRITKELTNLIINDLYDNENRPVYYDIKRKQFYWLEWNNTTRHYIS